MSTEDERQKLQKEIDASRAKPEAIDREAIGLREPQPYIEPIRDNRVLEMFNQILDRLKVIDGKIDDLKKEVQESRSR